MASIQIKTTINLEELLQAVEQLNFSDLEQLTEKVVALRQRKQAKSNNREAVLLAQIKHCFYLLKGHHFSISFGTQALIKFQITRPK